MACRLKVVTLPPTVRPTPTARESTKNSDGAGAFGVRIHGACGERVSPVETGSRGGSTHRRRKAHANKNRTPAPSRTLWCARGPSTPSDRPSPQTSYLGVVDTNLPRLKPSTTSRSPPFLYRSSAVGGEGPSRRERLDSTLASGSGPCRPGAAPVPSEEGRPRQTPSCAPDAGPPGTPTRPVAQVVPHRRRPPRHRGTAPVAPQGGLFTLRLQPRPRREDPGHLRCGEGRTLRDA